MLSLVTGCDTLPRRDASGEAALIADKIIAHLESKPTAVPRQPPAAPAPPSPLKPLGLDWSTKEAFVKSLEISLWTYRSPNWNGYIDFQTDGKYWTHWGFGRWKVEKIGQVHLANDFDQFTHELVFAEPYEAGVTHTGAAYHGTRSDGAKVKGELLRRNYHSDP